MNWYEKFPINHPGLRAGQGMAYDSGRDVVVFFGGTATGVNRNDTWEWDGTNWTLKSPATSPSARHGFGMAYDVARGETVLFGGFVPGGPVVNGQTYTWDGTNWTLKSPAHAPAARGGHGMAYDATRSEIVLFGGQGGFPTVYGDTWTWDGTDWTQEAPAFNPTARADGCSLAYDDTNGEIVMFSGGVGHGVLAVDDKTYTWDGTNWTQESPATSPTNPSRRYAPLSRAPSLGVVLFGGSDDGSSNIYNDTWLWNGTTWADLNPADDPPARAIFAFCENVSTPYGGCILQGGSDLQDTWTWVPPAGPTATPSYSIRARFGIE